VAERVITNRFADTGRLKMRKYRLATWCALIAMLVNAGIAPAQGLFRTELKNKYGFKTVSCYTCHSRKSEVADDQVAKFEDNSKSFRNAFGKLFDEHLKGKKVTSRLTAVKGLDKEDPKRMAVEKEVKTEFNEALKKIEATKAKDGKTYAEKLKKGEVDGVKLD